MSAETTNSSKKPKKRDPDMAAAEDAMKRAAAKARQRAKLTAGNVAIWKDGRVVEERQETSTGELQRGSLFSFFSP